MATTRKTVGRDARDGKFVTIAETNRRPSTTVVEHVYVPKPKTSK